MIRFLFLIPLVLSVIWIAYLMLKGWTLRQGLQGFVYIAVFSASIALFYTLLLWLTGS